MPRKIPPQVVRLVILTTGIVSIYLVAHYLLTPPSFGQYGWYRGHAIAEAASHELVYTGRAACSDCHPDQAGVLASAGHKTLSCEVCHGPGQEHAGNPDLKLTILHFGHCVRCHEAAPAKPAWMKQIETKDHYPGDACTDCHPPHQPIEKP